MDVSLIALICALGGGAFGSAIGGQPAFIFTGFMVFIGVAAKLGGAEFDFLGNIAFGPVFGPHISFAGAAAAVAFAAKRGEMETGRDIATPIAGVGKPDALVVGAVFGAGGYLVNQFLTGVLDGASWVDTIAMTVTISGLTARLMFGNGLFGKMSSEHGTGRYSVSSSAVWVGHQATIPMQVVLGTAAAMLSGYFLIMLHKTNPDLVPMVPQLLFGVSAVSLLLLQFGMPGPVTHHMTLPAAVAAVNVFAAGGSEGWALGAAVIMGIVGAMLAEGFARVFLIHGDTHTDPPAFAIAVATGIILLAQALF